METRLDPITLHALQAFGRRRRRLIAWRGVCAVVATALIAMSAVAFMDYLFLLSDAARLGLSFCAYIAVFGVLWIACLRWLMHSPDLKELAAMFEQRHAELHEEVLSAVELGEQHDRNQLDSDEFRAVIQQDVASRLRSLKVVQLLPSAMIRRWVIIAASVAALCILLASLPGLRFGTLIARAFAPAANLERVSRTGVKLLQPTNTEALFPRGDPLTIEVEVTGPEPAEVKLETFVKGAKVNAARMTPQGGQRYTAILAANDDSQAFRILAGDAISRRYNIQTRRRPHVASFHKTYHFPEYSRLKPHEVTEPSGDLEALEGSTADLLLEVDQPVIEAELRLETPLTGKARKDAGPDSNMKKDTIKLSVVNPKQLQGQIPMKASGSYTVFVVAKDTKFENKFSPTYKISALPDLTPSVLLQKPVANSVVTADQTVSLEGEAIDDLALKKVMQMTRVNNGPWQETVLAEEPGAEMKIVKSWDLLTLRAKPGDQIWTKLVAIDLKDSRSETPPMKLTVSSANFNPARMEKMAGKRTLLEALKALAAAGEDLAKQTKTAIEEVSKSSAESQKRKMDVAGALAKAEAADQAAETAWKALLETAKRADVGREAQELTLLSRVLSQLRRDALTQTQIRLRKTELAAVDAKEQAAVALKVAETSRDLANRARNAYSEWLAAAQAESITQDLRRLIKNQEQMTKIAQAKVAPAWDQLARQEEAAAREQMLTEGILSHLSTLMPSWQAKGILQSRRQLETAREEMEKSLQESTPGRWLADAGKKMQETLASQEEAFKKTRASLEGNAINSAEYVARALARSADELDKVREAAQNLTGSDKKIQELRKAAGEASKLAEEARRASQAAEAIDIRAQSAMGQLRDRAQMEEALGVHDPLFIADSGNAAAALGAVTQNATDSAQTEKAAQNLQALTKAYRALELGHDWVSAVGQMRAMVNKEQSKDPRKSIPLRTPGEWRQLELQVKLGQGQLDPSGMPKEVKKELLDTLTGRDMKSTHEELDKRHKDQAITASVAPQLENLGQSFGNVLTLADKTLQDARAVIASLSPKLSEQLKAVEKMAKETMEKTKETAKQTEQAKPEEARKETTQALEKQENVNTRLETVTDAIRRDANLQDLATKDGRERARDADDALAMLRQPPPKAKDLLTQAADSPEAQEKKEAREDLLNKAVDQQKQLDDALKTIAQHYENLEKGNAEETRQALRKAEEPLGIQQAMDAQYKQAERLAELAAKSPEELKPELEKELKTNQPMQAELGELADKAVADAMNALQQTVRQENEIAANLKDIANQQANNKGAEQARQNAEAVKNDAARQNDLKPPVQEAAAGLEKAAKEAAQLNRPDAAALEKGSEAAQQLAKNEMTKAEQAMAQAANEQPKNADAQAQAKQADQAKQAQAPVENARDAAAKQLANLAQAQDQAAQNAQAQNQPAQDPMQADTPQAMSNNAVNAAAEWMARALDQLEGAPPAGQQPDGQNADQGQQPGSEQGQPQQPQQGKDGKNAQKPGQNTPQNAAAQAIQQGLQSEQQAMAQGRAAMSMASQAANKSSDAINDILSKRGTGVMPNAVALKKGEWGKLRQREARDMIEAREDSMTDEYRGMVGAYFKAIAEKSKDQKR